MRIYLAMFMVDHSSISGVLDSSEYQVLSDRLKELTKNNDKIPPGILVSATYDGEKKKAILKFYDPETQRIFFWYDNSGHKPYCYSKLLPADLHEIGGRDDVIELVEEKKQDLIEDKKIAVTKIVATDPLAIGGSTGKTSIRDQVESWEADIKYYENFLYDKSLVCGAFYTVEDLGLTPIKYTAPPEIQKSLSKILDESEISFRELIQEWANLLSQPLPMLRRVALDIEVLAPEENRIPDPEEAQQPVIATSLVGNDERQEVLLLLREGVEKGAPLLGPGVTLKFFESEKDLVAAIFQTIIEYPFIITYNGDQFDLNYLYHRAQKLGFNKDEIPISLGRDVAYVRHGVHLDLYKTFINKSLQIYAFGGKYTEHTLGSIAEAILGDTKIEFEGLIGDLSLSELARYCLNDSHLTYRLTSYSEDLLCKLLLVLCRVGKMPIDDVARLGVSNWIRSLFYFEHRRINALIPRREELEKKGGAESEAVIKGKKYKGGIVIEPQTGVYFQISVLDFASLYPSIIKVHNLSYETVRCPHAECRDNLIPGTHHWACRKRKGIASLLIGSLRDLRVGYYKPLSKSKNLRNEDKELYNIVQQALKVILNASYGVMGAEIFPLYCLPVAESTAAVGRYAITSTIEKCRDLGIEVVYGDTDSLFLRSPSKEELKQITDWANNELGIELDLDKNYRYVAFSQRKKNYMGVLDDGKVDIKGLTGKKSHIPPFIKKAFYDSIEILRKVNSPGDFEKAKDDIKKEIRNHYIALKQRKLPIEDLAFNVMISKPTNQYKETTPQHVRAARLMEAKGKEVKAGQIISYVKTTTPPGVKPASLANMNEIDVEKYLDQMRSTFDQLLDALGYDFNEIMGVTKLEDYFFGS